MRRITLSRDAEKVLRKLPEKHRRQLGERLLSLASDARPHDSVKLKAQGELYRLTVGEYRVVYSFDADEVAVLLVDRRDRIYKRLPRRPL